jgi:hypothetical protein
MGEEGLEWWKARLDCCDIDKISLYRYWNWVLISESTHWLYSQMLCHVTETGEGWELSGPRYNWGGEGSGGENPEYQVGIK